MADNWGKQIVKQPKYGRATGLGCLMGTLLLTAFAWTLSPAAIADDDQGAAVGWTSTWATASKIASPFDGPLPVFNDTTLRQIVRISLGGNRVRVWLTNEFGTAPLAIDSARVALREEGSTIAAGSDRALTFGGQPTVTIAAGARVVSDPVYLRVENRGELAISIHLGDLSASTSPVSYHVRALQTSYLAGGNQTAAIDLVGAEPVTQWYFLAAVDVAKKGEAAPVIAAFGDSITDGDQMAFPNEPVDQNARYTDFLAERILRGPGDRPRAAVINLGISGNQISADFIGPNGQARLNRDVLTQTGVSHLIVIEGINDIGLPGLLTVLGIPTPPIEAEQIISAHQQIIARARARGLYVIGGTLSPAGSSGLPGYFGPEAEEKRQQVNHWIRTSGAYDMVVDFDRLLSDPKDPTIMRADLTADGLHPNSRGYWLMAKAIYRALYARDH